MPATGYNFIYPQLIEISWNPEISDEILDEILYFKNRLTHFFDSKIESIHVGFHHLTFKTYLPFKSKEFEKFWQETNHLLNQLPKIKKRVWKIPVCYDLEFAKDLAFMADYHQMSIEKIIELHIQPTYTLHFYGFLPGFMYLGGLDPQLNTPRKQHPELQIKEGSVAIGGSQTGIYPQNSPGGWHIIGKSPLNFFNTLQYPPVVPQTGEGVKFYPISIEKYSILRNEVISGQYEWSHE
jgi:KipI family sensor histidine kinase inhibitor